MTPALSYVYESGIEALSYVKACLWASELLVPVHYNHQYWANNRSTLQKVCNNSSTLIEPPCWMVQS